MKYNVPLLWMMAVSAPATTLTLTDVDATRGGDVKFLEHGVEVTGYAGAILANYTPPSGPTQALSLLCVDLFTEIGIATYGSDPYLPAPWRQEDRAAWLFVNHFAAVTTVAQGQGIQLAVWDIVHDGGDGLAAGAIRASVNTPVGVQQLWQDYLTLSLGQSSFAASIYYNWSGPQIPAQHLLSAFQPNSQTPVPEPVTWAMTAGALGALAVAKRPGRPQTARD